MIAAIHRFHGTNSLNYVYRNGKTLRSKYFSLKYVANSRRKVYRAAVVISKKVEKTAPGRNRIRRRLYELLRTEGAEKLGNIDIVINIYDEKVIDVPDAELRDIISRMLRAIAES